MKFFILLFYIFIISPTLSDDSLKNKITKNLRCLVCQGQTIAESNSDFAQTVKIVVEDQLNEGKSEVEVYEFLSEKYGDWILYKPPLKGFNYVLWVFPYLFFIAGAIVLLVFLRKKSFPGK
tara:strand:- start:1058 stop:1420 length:363 start_codon:yes stop_codon:yes gene_type:complete